MEPQRQAPLPDPPPPVKAGRVDLRGVRGASQLDPGPLRKPQEVILRRRVDVLFTRPRSEVDEAAPVSARRKVPLPRITARIALRPQVIRQKREVVGHRLLTR